MYPPHLFGNGKRASGPGSRGVLARGFLPPLSFKRASRFVAFQTEVARSCGCLD